MSEERERATPITNACLSYARIEQHNLRCVVVAAEVCRQMERERNELLDALEGLVNSIFSDDLSIAKELIKKLKLRA